MKELLIGLLALISSNAFAKQIECTEGKYLLLNLAPAAITSDDEDKLFSIKFEDEGNIVLLPNLVVRVSATDMGAGHTQIDMTVGQGSWEPRASAFGVDIVELSINANAIPSLVGNRWDGYDFPAKKLLESQDSYNKRLAAYVESQNNSETYNAFVAKYGQLATVTCRVAKQ